VIAALRIAVVVAAVLAAQACVPSWKQAPHDQLFQYEPPRRLIEKPAVLAVSDVADRVRLSIARPIGRLLSPGRYLMTAFGAPLARDVNRLGQVPDSAWFENRIGRRDYTQEEVAEGAAADAALAAGPLTVISGKLEGVSAGFVVRDTANQVWYLKLDHPAFIELSTSAEVISSRLLWLAGYHVPAMFAVDVDRSRFVLDDNARTRDKYNRSVRMTQANLDKLLANTNPDAAGNIRALISRQPAGEVLGSFSYRGKRLDDANDTIEHEHRRSLRGLWLFSAWINNIDTRDANTLDMFRPMTADGRGVVEHYLIDFGDSFGASGVGEKAASMGWDHLVDWQSIFINLFSAGLRQPSYFDAKRSPFRAVGLFESKLFDPTEWRPFLPNPAFDHRTREDVFWAASILARIKREHVEAAVTAGRYREPGAASYIVTTLIERREKLLEFAFAGYLELDRPRVAGTVLTLDNLRALGGLPDTGTIEYTVDWDRTGGFDKELARGELDTSGETVTIDLAPALAAGRAAGIGKDPYLTVELTRNLGSQLEVHLRVAGDRVVAVGVSRP
jgi:hypothetical protein